MSRLAKRFADALADITSNRDVNEVISQLDGVSAIIAEQKDLSSFLADKSVPRECRKETVLALFEKKAFPEIVDTLRLLVDIGRTEIVGDIAFEYRRITDKRRGILNMTIKSAVPLKDDEISLIGEKYKKLYNAKAYRVENVTDRSLIGGITVQIGDRVVDGSVESRLSGLGESLRCSSRSETDEYKT